MRRLGPSLLGAVLLLGACASKGPRSPEALRDAWARALASDDPEGAWELLAPQTRARMNYDDFAARWKANAAERKEALAGMRELPAEGRTPVLEGTTTHEGGRVLTWTEVEGEWLVVSGVPGIADTSTPAAAVRALVAALRSGELVELSTIVTPELLEQAGEQWQARANLILEALETPGSLTVSHDGARAVLRYARGHAITLQQTDAGWRVAELD